MTSAAESDTQCADSANPMGASLLQSADSIKKAKIVATEVVGDNVLPLPTKEIAKETAMKPEMQKSPDSLAQAKWWSGGKTVHTVEGPVVYYQAKYVLPSIAEAAGFTPPMKVASEAVDPEVKKAKDLGIDFEGIWWMSDNPVPEELVSFAGMKVETTNGGFPVTLKVPNAKRGMWSWLDTTVGKLLRQFYATGDPEAHTDFIFESEIEGEITTGLKTLPAVWVESFKFYKYTHDCDKTSGSQQACDPMDCAEKIPNHTCADLITKYPNDMWSRPTKFQSRSWFSDATYTLKRIVMGDGSPHPVFWDEFMNHMTSEPTSSCPFFCDVTPGVRGEKVMQSYNSDDWCTREDSMGLLKIIGTGCGK